MTTTVSKQDKETIIHIEGRVDTSTAPDLENLVREYFDIPAITLVFDCTKLEYVSSPGLRVLLLTHKTVTAKGGKFILRGITREVKSVIDLTGFNRILAIE